MATQTITITAGSLKTYLNKASVFVTKTKLGLHPLLACVYWIEDKCRVYNGETGAEIFLPFRMEQPVLFLPFDLAQLCNNIPEDTEITLKFKFEDNECLVKTKTLSIKFKLLNSNEIPTLPNFPTEGFEILELRDKLKRAVQYTSEDASLPGFQAVKVMKTHLCATDRNSLWRETLESAQEFTIPRLLADNIIKLGQDPVKFSLTLNNIFIFYQDMTIVSSRLEEKDDKNIFPPSFSAIFDKVIGADNTTEIAFDRDELLKNLEFITGIDLPEESQGAIQLDIGKEFLKATTLNKDASETVGEALVACTATNEYKELYLNSKLFARALGFFHKFDFKESANALYFKNADREAIVTRRKVR